MIGKYVNVDEYVLSDDYRFDLCDDYDRLIQELEHAYDMANSVHKPQIAAFISVVKRTFDPPSTGENTILYIAIASAVLAAMTALVVRRKREDCSAVNI